MNDYQQVIIASLIITPSLLAECDLSPHEFDEEHAVIYQAIIDVSQSDLPVDIISVCEYLERETGKSYVMYIGTLMKDCVSTRDSKHFSRYVEAVRDENRRQRSKQIAEQLKSTVDTEGMEAVDRAVRDLMALNSTRKNYECTLVDALKESLDEADRILNSGGLAGITTGLTRLDRSLGGLHNSDLIVVGARPAIGKTAFMINLALAPDSPVGIISTEQPRHQIGSRVLSADGKVSLHRMRTGDLQQGEWAKLSASLLRLKTKKVWINDNSSASVSDIVRQARKWKQLHDIRALYVDYIQRIPGDRRLPKHEQIDEIVRALKNLARELDIPVLALAQVSRQAEARTDKRPWMADLSDSSSIEKEADQIMLLYRDEVYNDPSPKAGILEIDIKKNRHGPVGRIDVAWIGEYVAIKDLDMRYAS